MDDKENIYTDPILSADTREKLYPVSPVMLLPNARGNFKVYVRQAGHIILYTNEGEKFTKAHINHLYENNMTEVYISAEQETEFEDYLRENLPIILNNEAVPIKEKINILNTTTLPILKSSFQTNLPKGALENSLDLTINVSKIAVSNLINSGGLKNLVNLLSNNFSTYNHGVQVFVYLICLLHYLGVDESLLNDIGLGAVLHDVGKSRLPQEIDSKSIKELTPEEYLIYCSHPSVGAVMYAKVPLSQSTMECILLHHELLNGSGFPFGYTAENIPMHVKALSICDIYDRNLAPRQFNGSTPFRSLQLIKSNVPGSYDKEIFKAFVYMLADAKII